MVHEDQLLMEYIDAELDAAIAVNLESQLAKDGQLRARYEILKKQREMLQLVMHTSSGIGAERIPYAQERVWERIRTTIQSRDETAIRRTPFWKRVVFVPLPVLALSMLAIFGVAGISLSQLGKPGAEQALASTELPSLSSQAHSAQAASFTQIPTINSPTYNLPLSGSPQGMTVTIQVEDLDQLLSIMEGDHGIKEMIVKLPAANRLVPVGEPMLMKATERR